MTMQIGPISVPECDEWSETGAGTIAVGGLLEGNNIDILSWQRRQLLGLMTGPRAVPVVLGHDTDRSGWYEVVSVDVAHVLGMTETRGERRWSATLRRLPFGAQPSWELRRRGTTIDNDWDLTPANTTAQVWLPDCPVAQVDWGIDPAGVTTGTRALDGGEQVVGGFRTDADFYTNVVRAPVELDDVYAGAARIEVDVTGTGDWLDLVGTELTTMPAANRWRLSNGHFRAWWDSAANRLRCELFDGTWHEASRRFTLGVGIAYVALSEPSQMRVLRNTTEEVTVELVTGTPTLGRVTVQMGVRRGHRIATVVLKSRVSSRWSIIVPSDPGGSPLNWTPVTVSGDDIGWREDDATSGRRWVLATPREHTAVNDDRALIYDVSHFTLPFGFGLSDGAVDSAGGAATVIGQYYAQPSAEWALAL